MIAFRCSGCRAIFPTQSVVWCCEKCGSPLSVEGTKPLRRDDIDTNLASLWRYQTALVHTGPVLLSLGEGWTPLVRGGWGAREILWKCEFISISGSFKDRGVSVMFNYLLSNKVQKVAEDSSGNGGAAVATYAAAAGTPCRIYVPANTSPGKISQIAATGAEVIRISGSRQDVAEAAMADNSGYTYASHNWDPAFLDGIKTVGYEIWEQLGFQAPDAIIAPTGGGSNLLGCFHAFSDLRTTGEINRLPRLYGAQSESCAPLAQAFAINAPRYVEIDSRPTIAEGIAVSRPVRSEALLHAVRQTGGGLYAVSEEEIASAHDKVARRGFYVEPTTASAVALLDKLLMKGEFGANERVVVLLTGSGLKAGELVARIREQRRPSNDC
jgi:threonine synthase